MPIGSMAFSSLESSLQNNEGINGTLTPARRHRRPQQQQSHLSAQKKYTNDHDRLGHRGTPGNTAYAHLHAAPSNFRERPPLQQGREHRSSGVCSTTTAIGKLSAGGEGISLQETEARIEELERSEFDLKMRLHYTEERLEEAVDGIDALQLHREIAHAKRLRAQAEGTAREVSAALSASESNCLDLENQVRKMEAKGKAEQEERAAAERANETRLKNHLRLLEGTLRAERAENARLRITASGHRDSWDDGHEGDGQSHVSARRRSTGESEGGQREHQQQLVAKVRSQDSSLRSLRADVTALRRRLRSQAETLTRQKEDNDVVRRAAEQVACLEAEEIARLAADLEQAVRTANAEAQRRREAEDRLALAEQQLATRKESDLDSRATDGRSSRRMRSRSRSRSPPQSPRDRYGRRRGVVEAAEKVAAKSGVIEASAGGAAATAASRAWGAGESEDASPEPEREKKPSQPLRRATGSTIASRGRRSVPDDRVARRGGESVGKGKSSVSPTGNRRRPRGSSSPPPSHRRENSNALSASDKHSTGRLSRSAESDCGRHAAGGSWSRRRPNGARTVAEGHGTSERFDPERERRVIESAKNPLPEAKGSLGGGRRHPSVGRCEASGSSRHPSPEKRSGAGHANAGSRRGQGRASGPITARAATAESDANTDGRRERRVDAVGHGGEEGSVRFDRGGAVDVDKAARKGAGARGHETTATAMRGRELAATVARELRLAVVTTSSASPESVAGFPAGSTGGNTPSEYCTGYRGQLPRGDDDGQDVIPDSRLREDPFLLLPRRKDSSSKSTDSVRTPAPSGEQSGDCEQSFKSREVSELESDVQHIFQFFSAARGLKTGKDGSSSRSGVGEEKKKGETVGGRERVEDYGPAIAKALSLWGGVGEGGAGR